MTKDIEATLTDREDKYGSFWDVAKSSQKLQEIIRKGKNFDKMSYAQREACFMICNKISRMINGDPTYKDNAHDLAGYSRLIEKDLEE